MNTLTPQNEVKRGIQATRHDVKILGDNGEHQPHKNGVFQPTDHVGTTVDGVDPLPVQQCAEDVAVAYPLFQEEWGGSTPTSALQLRVAKIPTKLACKLNALWHSRLPVISFNNIIGTGMNCCFAAEFGNRYYAVAIYSAPISRHLNDRKTLELRRLAISPEAPKNSATRILAITRRLLRRKMPHIFKLISYQDTEVHKGTIYKADGWKATVLNTGGEWKACKRGHKNNTAQSAAPKQRWERDLSPRVKSPTCSRKNQNPIL